MSEQTFYCEKCKKTMIGEQFYSSNNLEKYPNGGKLHQCKKCLTMHVNNWEPETYLWILQEIDVPYIPDEWNSLLVKFVKDPSKLTGTTILGRYLSKMKLKQWKDFRWEHTEAIQKMKDKEIEESMRKQGFDKIAIMEALEKRKLEMPDNITPPEFDDEVPLTEDNYIPSFGSPYETSFADAEELGLTEEDVTYLRLKWGKTYKPEEWVILEQLYEDMMSSYDINTAGHIDTLKLICKTSLKANQLIDIGDIESFQRVSKVYDGLMKSGKFTAAQNKLENADFVDSISELVAICESDGFIPRYYTDGPQDKVDRVLQDLQSYTRTLVTEEMHLGELIEQAVKQIEDDRQKEAQVNTEDDEEELMENEIFTNKVVELEDEAYEEFAELGDELAELDEETMRKIIEGEE